jgi:hypothetical protein
MSRAGRSTTSSRVGRGTTANRAAGLNVELPSGVYGLGSTLPIKPTGPRRCSTSRLTAPTAYSAHAIPSGGSPKRCAALPGVSRGIESTSSPQSSSARGTAVFTCMSSWSVSSAPRGLGERAPGALASAQDATRKKSSAQQTTARGWLRTSRKQRPPRRRSCVEAGCNGASPSRSLTAGQRSRDNRVTPPLSTDCLEGSVRVGGRARRSVSYLTDGARPADCPPKGGR